MEHAHPIAAALSAALLLAAFPRHALPEESDSGWSEEAANRNLAGLVEALLARDAAAAKPYFVFPLERPGLLPDVPEEDFESYFPELFDEGFFAEFEPEFREKGSNLWEQFSWRGFFAPGLSSADARKVTRVTYVSESEQARWDGLNAAEFATLAPPLRGGADCPRFAFETDDGEWRGRVDRTQNGGERIALWRRGHPLNGMPDVLCQAIFDREGQIGTIHYRPRPDNNRPMPDEFMPGGYFDFCHPFVDLQDEIMDADCTDGPPVRLVLSPDGLSTEEHDGQKVPWTDLLAIDPPAAAQGRTCP